MSFLISSQIDADRMDYLLRDVFFTGVKFGEYDIKISMRCWVDPEEYWPVYWEQLEAVKEALDREDIIIPIPRSQVYYSREDQES